MSAKVTSTMGALRDDSQAQISEVSFFLLLAHFALLWTGFTLFFDYMMFFRDAMDQYQTFGFVAVEGKVLKCAKTWKPDGEGEGHAAVDVEYSYRADNHEHVGNRIRYVDFAANKRVDKFVRDHVPGSPVTVYYDPTNPAAAVLEAGFDGRELVPPLALLPFNVVMFGLCCLVVVGALNGGKGWMKLYDGTRFVDTIGQARIRMPGRAPAAAALFALAITPVPVVLCIAVCVGESPVSKLATTGWAIVLASSTLVYFCFARRAVSGKYDLIVHHIEKVVSLPEPLSESEPAIIPLADLLLVDLITKVDLDSGRMYSVRFRWRSAGGDLRETRLKGWFALEQAEELVDWIRTRTHKSQSNAQLFLNS